MQKAIKTAAITILINILFKNNFLKFLNGFFDLSLEIESMESGVCIIALKVIIGIQNSIKQKDIGAVL